MFIALGFYDVDLGIVDPHHAGLKLMAIADVDSDGYADLITVTGAEDTFQVHFYDPATRTFAFISQQESIDKAKIASIVPARNMEVLQSLYVIYSTTSGDPGTYIKVYQQAARGDFQGSLRNPLDGWRLPLGGQPMFFDINGDMK